MRTAVALVLAATAGCASLPDTQFLGERYRAQEARMQGARGVLTRQQGAAIVAALRQRAGDLDILDEQLSLEQAIGDGPLVTGNRVDLLQDGPQTYAAMFAAMSAATDHIHLETYIFEDDEVGNRFAQLLIERQSQGVQVSVIYDSQGALRTPAPFFERMRQAGVQVLEFNPVNPLSSRKGWALNHRDHRKLLVVDGHVAFLGGINISGAYSSGSAALSRSRAVDTGSGWRDTDVRIEGPVVAEFQKLFLQTWASQAGPPMPARRAFPEAQIRGRDLVRAIGSSADDPFSLIYLTLIAAIGNAQQQVFIANAYFVPDPQLMQALLGAAARGVDVRLLLPGISDSGLAFHAGRSYYTELLRGGVRIYERHSAVLHSKTALIDGVWSCVGSSNLDWRSALDNDEINAVVLGPEFGGAMRAAYLHDLEDADAVELQAWEQREPMLRAKESLARLVGRLL